MISAPPGRTVDSILGGAITLIQPRGGYRFSVDAILLARFVAVRAGDRVLELGAGCGVIAMILAALSKPKEIVAVELQPALAKLIAENAAANHARITAICADLRNRAIPGVASRSFDLVIANPPYRRMLAGRASPDPERRAARSETSGTLDDFVTAAARYMRAGARVAMVFTADRSIDLIASLRAHALEPKRIRFVHPHRDRPASTILVEARSGAGVEATIEPPLVMYDRPGVYSAEANRILTVV
jgi:tRNA1Val (adenine37-N6)-methyltransferase